MGVVVSVSGVAKKTVVFPAVSTVARIEGSVPEYARHPMENHLDIPGRKAAATHGFLDPEASYRPQQRWKYSKKPTKPAIGCVISEMVQAEFRYARAHKHFIIGGVRNRHNGEDPNLRGDKCPENVTEAPAHSGVPQKIMGEVRGDNRGRNA